jgi:hypothetical protein
MARYSAEKNVTPEQLSRVVEALAVMEDGADKEAAEVLLEAVK